MLCPSYGSPIMVYNTHNPSNPINYGDTKHYCYKHKKIMISFYKNELKMQEKIEKQKAKLQVKEEKQKAKEESKMNAKIEKQKMKEDSKMKAKIEKQKAKEESKLKQTPIAKIETHNGCIQLLKTGPNKGKLCGCKIVANNMCKRHEQKITI